MNTCCARALENDPCCLASPALVTQDKLGAERMKRLHEAAASCQLLTVGERHATHLNGDVAQAKAEDLPISWPPIAAPAVACSRETYQLCPSALVLLRVPPPRQHRVDAHGAHTGRPSHSHGRRDQGRTSGRGHHGPAGGGAEGRGGWVDRAESADGEGGVHSGFVVVWWLSC